MSDTVFDVQSATIQPVLQSRQAPYQDDVRSLIERDPAEAATRLVAELSQDNLPPERKRLLIFAADELRFPDAGLRQKVCAQLLHHAAELKQSSSPDDVPAVNCAIRRAGSILPVERLGDLLPFLQGGSLVDTRLVALQAISGMFLQSPPPKEIDTQDMSLRALTIAEKHWDPDVFRAGEISALAIEATVATATLDPEEAKSLPAVAAQTKRRLLLRKVCQRLADVRANWKQASADESRIAGLDCLVQEFEDVTNAL